MQSNKLSALYRNMIQVSNTFYQNRVDMKTYD